MDRQQRYFGMVAALFLAAALVAAGSRSWRLQRSPDNPHHPTHSAFCDFQDVVYYPTRAAFAGVNPYDPRPADEGGQYFARYPAGNAFPLYAPFIFVTSAPFAVLDLSTAEAVYWIFSVGLLIAYSYFLLGIYERRVAAGGVMAVAALLLVSRPGAANFYYGNGALPMSLATVGSWLLANRRPWISGVLMALTCIKPTFGGPLFILLLVRGSYHAAFAGLGIAVAANLAVVAASLPQMLNPAQLLELLTINQAATESNAAVDPLMSGSRVDFLMVVERVLGRHLSSIGRYSITFAMLIGAGLVIRRQERFTKPEDQHAQWQSLALASLTVTLCIYHNIYDALLVAPAVMAAFARAKNESGGKRNDDWLQLAFLLVPAVNYFTSQKLITFAAEKLPQMAAVIQHPAMWTLLCILNGVCLTIAWAILLMRRLRPDEAAAVQASK